ncbi:MAG: hypothetical protein HYZ75_06565 [Elusimicrobia bacterium]|nr:hypothetical protein [Elusimicrobiota bacterium]
MNGVAPLVLSLAVSFAAVPAQARSMESLKALGARFSAASAVLPKELGDQDPARALRYARLGSDRAYRLGMDLQMMRRTAAEASTVLAEVATDPARRERLEFLLKFLLDAYPVQGDGASYVMDKALWLKYEIAAPVAPELREAVIALVERFQAADAATKALRADVDALAAAVKAAPAAGERSVWLSEGLADSAGRQEAYSAYALPKVELLLPLVR